MNHPSADTTTPRAPIRRVVLSFPFAIGVALIAVVIALIVLFGGSPQPAESAGESAAVRVSLAEAFFIQRHPTTRVVEWLGTLIIWFLLLLSATSVAMMVRYAADSRRAIIIPDELLARARALLSERRVAELEELTEAQPSFLARVIKAALSEHAFGHAAIWHAADQAGETNSVHMMRRIEPLNIIGNVAPMIGLFGTVYGMILAFREIVASGGTPDPVNLASGIGTALVTTFWGLVVAIPALAGYAMLRNRIDELTADAMRQTDEMLAPFREAPDQPAQLAVSK